MKLFKKDILKWFNIILIFLIFANVFDMGGAIGIKYFSYILVIAYLVLNIRNITINKNIFIFGAAVFIIWPIFSLGWGIINSGEFSLGLSQITAFFVMILFYIFIKRADSIQAVRYIYYTMFSLGLVIITLFTLMYIYPDAFYWPSMSILQHPDMGYFGFRVMGGQLLPIIYFRATLFLVPAFTYFYCIKKKLFMLICLIALICSFSKAAFIIIIVFLGVYVLIQGSSKIQKLFSLILILLLLVSVQTYMPSWAEQINTSIKGESTTAQVRIEHYKSFNNLLDQKPLYLLIGQGVGTKFYSSATDSFVSNIEIDHINTIRKFGIVWFLIFGLMVLNISIKLIKSSSNELKGCGYALIFSFIVTGTNPVLLSPLSLMLIVASYRALEGNNVRAS